jgi:hypothetical protein
VRSNRLGNRLKIALVERGNPNGPPRLDPRLEPIFAALEALGATAMPISYSEATADQSRAQLLDCDGVLVWVNPVTDGVDRTAFDALLRDVAADGVWVSAHPDVILKMGVKGVLPRTKMLGWGSDAHCYDSSETFRSQFPARLASDGVRVLKPNRGNGSRGVLKIELTPPTAFPSADSRLTIVEAHGRHRRSRRAIGRVPGPVRRVFGDRRTLDRSRFAAARRRRARALLHVPRQGRWFFGTVPQEQGGR